MDRRPARHPTQYTWGRRRRRRSVGGNWLRVSFWNLWSTWFVSCVMMKLGGARDRENVRQAASGGPDERFFFLVAYFIVCDCGTYFCNLIIVGFFIRYYM
ncbi:hypothetical protein P167DRAFT_144210 [Morchella conica CCBAS932]|uniref:Uncharacterized protein n=1 Tax=Morchella conica CCBAS932 TaxID=1392247 RepID=A0A3N4KQJ6_9PEZI|nr:hypothetical protein P167DRAFT_144210 [Morchella conica CCBAS932]